MSFIEKLIKKNSERKEAPCHQPKQRPALHEKPLGVSFRSEFYQKTETPNGVLEEQPAENELFINSAGFAREEDVESSPAPPTSSAPVSEKRFRVCPFEVGSKGHNLPKEQQQKFRKDLLESTMPRLSFDYASVDYIIVNGSEESKMLALGMRGMMSLMEVQSEKLMTKKPTETTKDVLATLDPSSFLNEQEILVETLEGGAMIVVNHVLSSVPAQSGCLRRIIQSLGNRWIEAIMAAEDKVMYSTSDKPKPPQISLPTRFLNGPIGLIFDCVKLNISKDASVKLDIALFFKMHITNLFNQSRNDVKNGRKRKAQSDGLD